MYICITMFLIKIKTFFNAFGTSTAWAKKTKKKTDLTEKIGKSSIINAASESRSISTRKMQLAEEIGTCVAVRNQRGKDLDLLGSIKIGLWSNGRSCGQMSLDFPCSSMMGTSG